MIVWVDVESTGLDPKRDHLLEVALVVTDDALNEVAYTGVVMQPVGVDIDSIKMDAVVEKMHTENGLFEEVRLTRGRRHIAEERLRDWLSAVVRDMFSSDEKLDRVPLAGSTVGFDRAFLREHMPALESMFSYRSIDVSSITELAKRWAPAIYEKRPKAGKAHRALADVRESIEYLRFYRREKFIDVQP